MYTILISYTCRCQPSLTWVQLSQNFGPLSIMTARSCVNKKRSNADVLVRCMVVKCFIPCIMAHSYLIKKSLNPVLTTGPHMRTSAERTKLLTSRLTSVICLIGLHISSAFLYVNKHCGAVHFKSISLALGISSHQHLPKY